MNKKNILLILMAMIFLVFALHVFADENAADMTDATYSEDQDTGDQDTGDQDTQNNIEDAVNIIEEDPGDGSDGIDEDQYPGDDDPALDESPEDEEDNETIADPEDDINSTDVNETEVNETDDPIEEPEPEYYDECANIICDDGNECTNDYCENGRCHFRFIPRCFEKDIVPVQNETKEDQTIDFDSTLISEMDGTYIGIDTKKKQYAKGEDVLTVINAPEGSVVELSFIYHGIKQYIKLPQDKVFPFEYLLPIPDNINQGVYLIKAAVYHAGSILKTDTSFEVVEGAPQTKISNAITSTVISNHDTVQKAEKIGSAQSIEPQELPKENTAKNDLIEIGKPVKWSKTIEVENYDSEAAELEILVNIPESAKKVKVRSPNAADLDAEKDRSDLKINDVFEPGDIKGYTIEFETPPAEKTENIHQESDEWKKQVTIQSSPELEGEYEYKNVFSETDILETEKNNIRLYWTIDNEKVDVTDDPSFSLEYIDTNNNGLVDRLTWVTPHLSIQEFEVIITLSTTNDEDFDVTLIEPDGQHYNNETGVDFRFIVSYNTSINLTCEISVDNSVIEALPISDGQETSVPKNINLDEGSHNWSVFCFDQHNNSDQSSQNSFMIDDTPPELDVDNNTIISLEDYVDIKFTATDNYASELDCNIMVNGESYADTSVISGSEKTVTVSDLDNGTYYYNITCQDQAGNSIASNQNMFYIDTDTNFTIITSKSAYRLKEALIFQVNAPAETAAKVVITDPDDDSHIYNYNSFPVVGEIESLDIAGLYSIDAYFTRGSAIRHVKKNFSVANTMYVTIELNDTKIEKGKTITFRAEHHGGVGNVTYKWDFDDASLTGQGKQVNHKYDNYGRFDVKVIAEDSAGNTAEETVTVKVSDKYSVSILVKDKETGSALDQAEIFLNDEERKTGTSGSVSFGLFQGKYSLFVKKSGYSSYLRDIEVTADTKITVELRNVVKDSSEPDTSGSSASSSSASSVSSSSSEGSSAKVESVETANQDIEASDDITQSALDTIDVIEQSLADFDKATDEEIIVLDILDIKSRLEKELGFLKSVKRDMFNLEQNKRGLSEEQIEKEKQDIADRIEQIRQDQPKSITIISSDQFETQYTDKEFEKIIDEYIDSIHIELTEAKKKKYIELVKKLQNNPVDRAVRIVELESLSGKKSTVTAITEKIDIQDNSTFADDSYVMHVPKDIAESAESIEFVSDHEILKDDPLISFDIVPEISYYFNKELTKQEIRSIQAVVIKSPDKFQSIIGSVTGLVTARIPGIKDPWLIIEILVVFMLIVVLVSYQFDLVKMITRQDPKMKEINGFINDARKACSRNDFKNAVIAYKQILPIVKQLRLDQRKRASIKVESLKHHILFKQAEDQINKGLEHPKSAAAHYSKVKQMYRRLSPSHQARIAQSSKKLFEKIKNGK